MGLSAGQQQAINQASQSSGIPAGVLSAIALQESSGNQFAINDKSGAAGLFGILPSTANDPGYGVAPITRTGVYDPATSANFAGSYLAALQRKTGSLDAAVSAYSGGGYTLAGLQAKYPDQFAGGAGAVSGTSSGGASSSGASSSSSSSVGSLINPVWEVVSRGLLLACGFALVSVALIAMLWQSKTVQTTTRQFASAASKIP